MRSISLEEYCLKKNRRLLEEWDYEKNLHLNPKYIAKGSHKKAWWICINNHSYEAKIENRVSGTGCPYCSGKKVLKGFNDIATTNPELISQWDFEKNVDCSLYELSSGSHKSVWWKCKNGHSYLAKVYNRVNGKGCPYCSGQKVLKGFNDLASTNPKLIKEWDYEKNINITPYEVSRGSNKKVWWTCNHKHNWKASVSDRSSGKGCPYCSGNKVKKGFNDLATTNPKLAKEWDYSKNKNLTPYEVTKSSGLRVWWLCPQGHSYPALISNRTAGKSCRYCQREFHSSFPEQAIFYYVKQIFPSAVNGDREILEGKELDIFIPEIKSAIEVDGAYWHNKINSDIKKNKLCQNKKISLIRIRDIHNPVMPNMKNIIIYSCNLQSDIELTNVINKIFQYLSVNIDVDIIRDKQKIYSEYIKNKKAHSLAKMKPDLVKEWDFERNNHIDPNTVSAYSNKKFYWLCKRNHSWQSTIAHRSEGKNCPYCTGKKVLKGFNDLATTDPFLTKEWDANKNKNISPYEVSRGSNKKVWWKCKNGHSYDASISNRTSGSGCPYCAGKKVLKGFNDLASTNPWMIKEWDYEKNVNISPFEVSKGSNKKVWWKCKNNHSWEATIKSRNNGKKCPYC